MFDCFQIGQNKKMEQHLNVMYLLWAAGQSLGGGPAGDFRNQKQR